MALADSRTHLEESENGTLYGTRTERVAVQGADGEWIAGIRKIEMALITLPNGAARIITRTQEAVGIMNDKNTNGHQYAQSLPDDASSRNSMSCSLLCTCCCLILPIFLFVLYLFASSVAIIANTAASQQGNFTEPCSSLMSRSTAAIYAAASFLLIIVCLCCTLTCSALCCNNDGDSMNRCRAFLACLFCPAVLGVLATFIAVNVIVFKDIGKVQGAGCQESQTALNSAILIDVAVGLGVLILLLCCCVKCVI